MTRRVLACAALLLLAACGGTTQPRPAATRPAPSHSAATRPAPSHSAAPTPSRSVDATAVPPPSVPRFTHIVVVVEENHAYSDVIGSASAPYINRLARGGVLLADSYAVSHPSEPNYLALFSGSTHGVTDDSCPHTYRSGNLGAQLRAAGQSFAAYSESLPGTGYLGCSSGSYARKHAPWTDFSNIPASVGKPMTAFPSDYTRLPRVAFVVPNLQHDMHDGSVAQGDTWLRDHLARYAAWAVTHNSLLIVTWDEDDDSAGNHIPGLLAGAHLHTGRLVRHVDHYTLLRTIEAACGLAPLGAAAQRQPITTAWRA